MKKRKFSIFLFLWSLIVPIICAFIFRNTNLPDKSIENVVSYILFFIYGGSIFVSMAITILCKLSWDNDSEYVGRVVLSFNLATISIVSTISIIYKLNIVGIILFISCFFSSVILLWKETPKREIIT